MTLPDDFDPIVTLDDGVVLALGFDHAYWFDGRVERIDRFVQLLERLDARQRASIGLTPPRLAALVMLDELRGLYATGEHEQAKRLVDRVLAELEEAFGPVVAIGEAKLMRPIRPDLGRLAEQAIAAFLRDPAEALGRGRQLRTLADPDPERARRRAAFATIDPPGFEMIQLPCTVVHPTKLADAAAKLGVSVDEARKLLTVPSKSQTAAELHAKLGPELLVRAIPRIPEDDRPPLYIPPATWFAGVTNVVEPLSAEYARLEAMIARHAALVEVRAPSVIDNAAFGFQRIVDYLAKTAAAPLDSHALAGWGFLDGAVHPRLPYPRDVPLDLVDATGTPPSCVWLTADQIAVATGGIMRLISVGENRVIREVAIGDVELQSCDDRYIITSSPLWGGDGVEGFGCYDIEARTWLDELPVHLPAVAFGYDQDEDGFAFYARSWLVDHRRGGRREFNEDTRPLSLAWTRGNDAVLLYPHGVYSTRTMVQEVAGTVLGKRAPFAGRDLSAITRFGERWRFLLPSQHVCEVDKTLFEITFPIDAVSFSPDGNRLLVLAEGEARIVDIAEHDIVWRYLLA